MSQLTKAQQQALALDKPISVTAGAGSGKTKILVERFLKIVLNDPHKIHRILAITFTNKAAGEMQERLAVTIQNLLQQNPSAVQKRNLLYIRDHLSSANVSTIHSFCAKVLREFPLESGLAPNIIELDEMQSLVLRQQALEKAIEEMDALPTEEIRAQWLPLFRVIGRKPLQKMLELALKAPYAMQKISERFQNLTFETYQKFLNDQWLVLLKSTVPRIPSASLLPLVRSVLGQDRITSKNEIGQKVKTVLQNFSATFTKANASETERYAVFSELVLTMTSRKGTAYVNLSYLGKNSSWSGSCRQGLTELSKACAVYAPQILELNIGQAAGEPDRRWFSLFKRFLQLYRNTRHIYRRLKNEQAGVDFEDLQLLTLQLLTENDNVSQELQSRFDFIMVDEFQDTNELQWQIIRRLADSVKSNLFVVGDPKQSIYGFRDADIRVFRAVRRQFATAAGAVVEKDYAGNVIFKESFRFLPRLNSFINFLFARILRESEQNPFEVNYQPLDAARDVPLSGWIHLALLEDEEEADYMAETIFRLKNEEKIGFVVENQKEISRPLQYGDMAILMRSRNALLPIEQALRKRNIPFKTIKGVGFWQRQEIFDFYHLLRLLDNPDDDFAMVGVLRSGLFLLSDALLYFVAQEPTEHYLQKLALAAKNKRYSSEDKILLKRTYTHLAKWISCRERMSLSELLHSLIHDIRLKAQLAAQLNGEQLVANLEKIVELAERFDLSGPGGLGEFIKRLDDLIETQMREGEAQINLDDPNTVKVMTIHAAKGLQFPVVFVPFLNNRHSEHNSVFMEAGLGLAAKLNGETHLLYRLLHLRRRQKEQAEAKRLFYVAATRASNYLFLSGQLKKGKITERSTLAWLQNAFALAGYDIFQTNEIQHDDFTLEIERTFNKSVAKSDDFLLLQKGLYNLSKQIEQPQPAAATIPAYLQPLNDRVGSMIFSATRLMTYLQDAEAYYQRYHLGFFENDYQTFAKDVYRSDYGLLKGKIIHRFLERKLQSHAANEAIAEQVLFEYDVFDLTLQQELKEELYQAYQKIKNSDFGKKMLSAGAARNEISLTMRLGADYFTGTLDRLFKNADGVWEVLDYKTNRISAGQVKKEAEKYKWQVRAYALLLNRFQPAQKIYPVSLYFLKPDTVLRQIFTKEDVRQTESFFIKTITEIKKRFPVG